MFITEECPHEVFKREGNNLVITHNVTLLEGMMGTIIKVDTLDDRTFRVPITDIIT